MVKDKTTIWLDRKTKSKLDTFKVCPTENYNSLILRLLLELQNARAK